MLDEILTISEREAVNPDEVHEWLDSLEDVLHRYGPKGVKQLLVELQHKAYRQGVTLPFSANTPYINTIPAHEQPRYPGNRELERRIKSIVRWNAMAMVVRANRESSGIGGHISTYASAATLFEVAFNHFLNGKSDDFSGDQVYLQGHASPGVYSRAFIEGRLTEENMKNFRRELAEGGGLSSYPHPWLMPTFWEFPTVSMGLGPICSIYQARFNRYLEHRGLKDTSDSHVWCFCGDGEMDEPESLGAITLAAREGLDNLVWVVNCNLQRLDGPVRGNGKIVQELEAAFRGAGWNVIKVLWGSEWDPLLAADKDGELVKALDELVDGQSQKLSISEGAYVRENFFGQSPKLRKLVEKYSDEQLVKMKRGGHDPEKVFAAYKAAVDHEGSPTVILAQTIKGYGLGEAGEGRNVTHQQKKMNEEELREFRTRFNIPISDDDLKEMPFFLPPEDSDEMKYLHDRRKKLGGSVPGRLMVPLALKAPKREEFAEFFKDSGGREVATTMAFVRMFGRLLRHPEIGKYIVPIIPDEARTFGMEALFRQCGIYASKGQLYEPVDADTILYYKEAKDGQILEEGITEAGSMASFVAAGTAYVTHGINMIPFYMYYSMFGFQRVGDLVWLAGDTRAKGFMLGGTAGRTTLNGEGLQHQDGHSHLLMSTVPNCRSYDPAFSYEMAIIIQDGIRRMYEAQEDCFYYITMYNEPIQMPAMPKGVEDSILKGMYKFKSREAKRSRGRVQLFGSGTILPHVLKAQDTLAEKYHISSDVWSVTSYTELRRDALACERWNRLNPSSKPRTSFLEDAMKNVKGPFIAASDYMKAVPDQISRWLPDELIPMGTDGFGRSDSRAALRRFFEVDSECITIAALDALRRRGTFKKETVSKAIKDLGVDPKKLDPAIS